MMISIITDEKCLQYHCRGRPESPQRIRGALERLKTQKELSIAWEKPLPVEESALLKAHRSEHLQRLSQGVDFDADTPFYPGIKDHALRSVGAALQAMKLTREGKKVFSLMRPPGHHAEREKAMGFCYLNQIAIAALEGRATGISKVAVYDFDVHHGNGTEAILLDQPGCACFSIHQHPCYPGTGVKTVRNAHNYPMPPGSSRKAYRDALLRALEDLHGFGPDLIAISAGFDAFAGDPLADEPMEAEDYQWLGEQIRSLNIPAFSVLEGGYSEQLPELIFAYLKGIG